VRAAIQSLPWRERKVIGLYYYGEVTMKQIGAEIGVNESRVSQLHARAIRRLRDALVGMNPQQVAEVRAQLVAFATRPSTKPLTAKPEVAVVLPYKVQAPKPAPARATLRPRPRQRQKIAAAR